MCVALAIEDLEGVVVHKFIARIILDVFGEEESRCERYSCEDDEEGMKSRHG